jgi:hypothetical protein
MAWIIIKEIIKHYVWSFPGYPSLVYAWQYPGNYGVVPQIKILETETILTI